jgi:hypothetical protein
MTSELLFAFYQVGISETVAFRHDKLITKSLSGNMIFLATSGLRSYQSIRSCSRKGRGGIPPCELVGISNYTVATKPLNMPNTRGIMGNFYQIFPYSVEVNQFDKKTTRGDFGIHQDAGVLGTSGCIAICSKVHWEAFEKFMRKVSSSGEETIKLFVPMGY